MNDPKPVPPPTVSQEVIEHVKKMLDAKPDPGGFVYDDAAQTLVLFSSFDGRVTSWHVIKPLTRTEAQRYTHAQVEQMTRLAGLDSDPDDAACH